MAGRWDRVPGTCGIVRGPVQRTKATIEKFDMDKSALICYNVAYWFAGIFMKGENV